MGDSLDTANLNREAFEGPSFLVEAGQALVRGDNYFRDVLDALSGAVYITDAAGLITYCNDAAAALWGRRPALGHTQWCGSWKLFWPDGRPMPHDACPLAKAIREQRASRGLEFVAERPDGVRVHIVAHPTPLFDAAGSLIGAVNLLVDITNHKCAEAAAQRLASIIEFSDDAIISKDINGVITSWNRGAERLFGYTAAEIIGKSITTLIPADHRDEEPKILRRIRRGEKIDHYETVRQRKDGSLVHISLTASPVKNAQGKIIGASKIARDITERKHAEEQQSLLLREMDHRIKNLFALASSVVTLSARTAATPEELASAVRDRLDALARAHTLTLPKTAEHVSGANSATMLHALIQTIASPYEQHQDEKGARVVVNGPDLTLAGGAMTSFALLLHEFATNAAKYGALSTSKGIVKIECAEEGDRFIVLWQECGGPRVEPATSEGFGSMLARATVKHQLGGEISRDWRPEGLRIRFSVARDRVST
jgi:PAS domain S-box-containing protein